MALEASAYVVVEPSFEEPEILLQYSQVSGYICALAEHKLRVRLPEDALLVYMKQLNIRTKMAAAQSGFNELPGVDIFASQISTMTYGLKCRSIFDHHDVAAGARWGFSTVEAYRLGMRQANFQLARDASLYGMNPQLGEGILNTPGATAINLPADSYGNDTVVSYDNGEAAFFLAQLIKLIKTNTLQLGQGRNFTALGPQRTLGEWEYNIVSLVQYQRDGAGVESTKGTLEGIMARNKDKLTWCYDDTLIGAGDDGMDAIIIIMTELDKPDGAEGGTNAFADLAPGNKVISTQYCDMAAPREIMSPLAAGATDFIQEWRISPGWVPRPQGLVIVSATFSS
jgi:hypothetical protein